MLDVRSKTIHDTAYSLLVERLRAARLAVGMTQVELAERLGSDQSLVSKYERLERRIDVIEVREVCIALRISFPEFILSFEEALLKVGQQS